MLTDLVEVYKNTGLVGFLIIIVTFLLIVVIINYIKITKQLIDNIAKLEKEYKRMNDLFIGTSAFIQSFLSVLANYEELFELVNERICQRMKDK